MITLYWRHPEDTTYDAIILCYFNCNEMVLASWQHIGHSSGAIYAEMCDGKLDICEEKCFIFVDRYFLLHVKRL